MIDPVCSDDVVAALADGRAVVALESTIFSHLGLPTPFNREALERCLGAVRDGGAVPAVTAVLDGVVRLGLNDAELDAHGYVYATLAATTDRDVPVICWCAHMDTSPEAPGAGVQPIVHREYDGGVIRLPHEGIVLDPAEHPDLRDQVGSAIVTADGRTLLGADNKAGIAEIMAAVEWLVAHPEVAHGAIKILFTPDEEVGRGTAHVNLTRLGADFAYTVDGERRGTLEDETFSADGAVLTFTGANTHPGFAKGKMVNALKGAGALLDRLAHDWSPEGTDRTDGFVHPYEVTGSVESAQIHFILRSFRTADLATYAEQLRALAADVCIEQPGLSFSLNNHHIAYP